MTTENPNAPTPNTENIDLEQEFERLSKARDEGEPLADFGKESSLPAESAASTDPAPSPTEPPAVPAPTPAPAAKAEAGDGQAAPAPIDWSTLPPAVKAEFDRKENERRAAVGRAAAAQREAALLKRQAASPTTAPAQPAASGATDKLKEEFPELNAALDERETRLQALMRKELENSTAKVKAEALNAVFPGWHGTMASPEFQYWLTTQDDATRAKFDGDSVGDYATLLRDFHGSNGTAQATAANSAASIQAARNSRLENSTHVQGRRTAPNPTGEPDPSEGNGEAYFNYLSRRRSQGSGSARR